jgi:hypothetical protein
MTRHDIELRDVVFQNSPARSQEGCLVGEQVEPSKEHLSAWRSESLRAHLRGPRV